MGRAAEGGKGRRGLNGLMTWRVLMALAPVHWVTRFSSQWKKANGGQCPPFFRPWVELPSDNRKT
jgi:hypothetical protein